MGGPGVCHSVYKMVDSGSEIFATFEELKKKFVHISLLNALLLFMGCRSRLRDCPRNIDVECSFGVSSH